MKDWNRNGNSIYVTLGASNHTEKQREVNDYYATEPKALELLLDIEKFSNRIWECACGEGHLSKVLKARGYDVYSTDLIDRGYGEGKIDFLKCDCTVADTDIITNPPYKYALEFAEHALELLQYGRKLALFLKLQFLEGKKRREFFNKYPPKIVYVPSSRLNCAMNGEFKKYPTSPICYAWFIWEKGYTGDTIIKWFN